MILSCFRAPARVLLVFVLDKLSGLSSMAGIVVPLPPAIAIFQLSLLTDISSGISRSKLCLAKPRSQDPPQLRRIDGF